MDEEIELMSLEEIDNIDLTKVSSKSDPMWIWPKTLVGLCNTARAAHKLKQRVAELEETLERRNETCAEYLSQIDFLRRENDHFRMRPADG